MAAAIVEFKVTNERTTDQNQTKSTYQGCSKPTVEQNTSTTSSKTASSGFFFFLAEIIRSKFPSLNRVADDCSVMTHGTTGYTVRCVYELFNLHYNLIAILFLMHTFNPPLFYPSTRLIISRLLFGCCPPIYCCEVHSRLKVHCSWEMIEQRAGSDTMRAA